MARKMINITGIILAGGRSSRMGRDKALLDWNGKPLIQHIVEHLRPFLNDVMVVAKSEEKFSWLAVPVYEDLIEASTPLAGIITGLRLSPTDQNFIMACDMPLVTPALIRGLAHQVGHSDAVLPESGFGMEPLCGIYRKNCAEIFEVHLRTCCPSVLCALRDLTVNLVPSREWPREKGLSFLNLNNRREYLKALQSHGT